MQDNRSLLNRYTSVAGQIGAVLTRIDPDTSDRHQTKLIGTIKHLLGDARLDIRDWEMSDSRGEMQKNAKSAVERIEQARAGVLLASEYNIFSPVEIAEISAQFDSITYELKS